MNKFVKFLFLISLAGFVAVLSGCGGDGDTASLEGTWQASKLAFTGVSGDELSEPLPATWVEILTLNPDGTFAYSSTQSGKTVTGTGFWGLDGTSLVLAQQREQPLEYRIDGHELVLSGYIPEGAYSLLWTKIAEAE